MPRNLVFIGFMGVGKSVVGLAAARRLGCGFIDLDDRVAERAGRSIPQIFREDGEGRFRALEAECLDALASVSEQVVSVGGGVPCRERNVPALRALGMLVHLTARPESIMSRVQPLETRPLLAGAPDPLERVRSLLEQRRAHYEIADLTIATDDLPVEACAERAVHAYREWLESAK
jgi:shikimate kinase